MKVHHSDIKLAHGPSPAKGKPLAKLPVGRKKPKAKGPPQDDLTLIWEWYSANNRDLGDAPEHLVRNAHEHVKARINILRGKEQTARVLTQTRWLARWSDKLSLHLNSQQKQEAA